MLELALAMAVSTSQSAAPLRPAKAADSRSARQPGHRPGAAGSGRARLRRLGPNRRGARATPVGLRNREGVSPVTIPQGRGAHSRVGAPKRCPRNLADGRTPRRRRCDARASQINSLNRELELYRARLRKTD
ncbi:hypothetical protein CUJ88_49615 (plasmid) [Paraburkholderia hospita]|nr:hypothetical protein CUJ88_49615 [Paraburkholderia hospita]